MVRALGIGVVAAGVAVAGCRVARDLLPHTYGTSVSPDGRHTAYVWQAPSIDPPDDHLYLSTNGGPARSLMDLAADADWSRTVIWARDSRRVGFLINGERLAVFEAETGRLDAMMILVGKHGSCCGGKVGARGVAFTADGTHVSFEEVQYRTVLIDRPDGMRAEASVIPGLTPTLEARPTHTPEKSAGVRTLRIPTSQVRLRLNPASAYQPSGKAWMILTRDDGGWVDVPAPVASDGLAVLPAFIDGPIAKVEVRVPGQPKRVILRNVSATEEPIVVDVAGVR